MSKRRVAGWFMRKEPGAGWIYIVRTTRWPKEGERWFKEKEAMIEWAHGAGIMLRDERREEVWA